MRNRVCHDQGLFERGTVSHKLEPCFAYYQVVCDSLDLWLLRNSII